MAQVPEVRTALAKTYFMDQEVHKVFDPAWGVPDTEFMRTDKWGKLYTLLLDIHMCT